MTKTERKQIFLKAYCHNNLGDDLFVRILCSRYPEADFICTAKENYMGGLKDIANLKIVGDSSFRKTADSVHYRLHGITAADQKGLKESDAAVILGGSMFIQNENWQKQLREYMKFAEYAKRFCIIGANFGPYHDDAYLSAYRELFAEADSVCFRDQKSYDLFRDIPSVSKAPDVVFQYDTDNSFEKENILSVIPVYTGGRKQLAPYHDLYTAKTAEVCEEAVRRGLKVYLLAFCKDQKDDLAVQEILSSVKEEYRDGIETVCYENDRNAIIDIIAKSQYVLATRFHGMILGWLYGCRTLPLIYDIKTENYLEDTGYMGKRIWLEDMNELNAEDLFEAPLTDVKEQIEEAEKQFAGLDAIIRDGI